MVWGSIEGRRQLDDLFRAMGPEVLIIAVLVVGSDGIGRRFSPDLAKSLSHVEKHVVHLTSDTDGL